MYVTVVFACGKECAVVATHHGCVPQAMEAGIVTAGMKVLKAESVVDHLVEGSRDEVT